MSLVITFVLAAGAFDQTFDLGVEAYHQEDYATAIDAFEQLVEQGVVNATVFYNLGNAYYRTGRLGPAIANYERALQVQPGFREARDNLYRCVGKTERQLARPASSSWEHNVFFWHDNLSWPALGMTAAAAWIVFWLLLSIRALWRLPYLRLAATAAGVVLVLAGATAWAKYTAPALAVAEEGRVPVRYGTGQDSTVRFELYEGDRVLVDRRSDGWVRVTTHDGERGWTQASRLLFTEPPFRAPAVASSQSGEDEAPS